MIERRNTQYVEQDDDRTMYEQMERMIDTYDSYMNELTLGQEYTLREMAVSDAQITQGDCVLEAGSATGTLALAANGQAGPSGTAFGIDVIPGMIQVSQRKAEQADLDVVFKVGNTNVILFPANHFAVAICSLMIFHTSEKTRRQGVAEIQRVPKPQEKLFINFRCWHLGQYTA